MANISEKGIQYGLTKNEFELLPYLDGRLFVESAAARFSGWVSPFDRNYLDWPRRISIQEKMCECLETAIKNSLQNLERLPSIKIIYLGAALGSICSYFTLNVLRRYGLLDKTKIYLYDLLPEPLMLTKLGMFEFTKEAAEDCKIGDSFSPEAYKEVLASCEVISGNIVQLPENLSDFDIAVAPYIHHHLNIFDKKKACQEMQRILKRDGIALIGDLTFTYEKFFDWLQYHKVESIPYALESFVSIEKHIEFFKSPKVIHANQGDIFYNFSLSF